MKAVIFLFVIFANCYAQDEIILSRGISKKQQILIKNDLEYLKHFNFNLNAQPETLRVLELKQLNSMSAYSWLKKRVNFIVEENALSPLKVLFFQSVSVDEKNVQFPYAHQIPYSLSEYEFTANANSTADSRVLMSNLGAAMYINGKKESKVFAMKIRPSLTKVIRTKINSPRVGIIQIEEAYFSTVLNPTISNLYAKSHSIARLSILFHEGKHSDGHGASLGFIHGPCPRGHDMEGFRACDENLNGPYSVGAQMAIEMIRAEKSLPIIDKEIALIMALDNQQRVLRIDQYGKKTINWSSKPEVINE